MLSAFRVLKRYWMQYKLEKADSRLWEGYHIYDNDHAHLKEGECCHNYLTSLQTLLLQDQDRPEKSKHFNTDQCSAMLEQVNQKIFDRIQKRMTS